MSQISDRPTRRSYPWRELLVHGRKRPGIWWLPLELRDVPWRIEKRIRLRAHPELRVADGQLEARATNEYTDEYGVKRADVWIRFVPFDTEPHRGRMEQTRRRAA